MGLLLKRTLRVVATILLFCAASGQHTPSVSAASSPRVQGLTISPEAASEVLDPGSVRHDSLSIRNSGKTGYNYSVYVRPYNVQGENYFPNFKAVPGWPDISSWFQFTSKAGYLNSGSSAIINYTITVPQNTPSGGYYAAVFVQSSTPSVSSGKSGFQIYQRAGEILYIQIPGPVHTEGRVITWHGSWLQQAPVHEQLRIENKGQLHYMSKISVSYEDILGATSYRYNGQFIILPHTVRRVNVQWPNPPFLGLFKVTGNVWTYGNQHLSAQYVLVVSPLTRIIVLVLFCLLVGVSLARVILRGHLHKHKKSIRHRVARKR